MALSVKSCPVLGMMLLGLATVVFLGCGSSAGYPKAEIHSPLGREGTCTGCGKKIASVIEENLVTFNGIQVIVCNATCAAKAKAAVLEEGHHEH